MSGSLEAIWIKRRRRRPMEPVERCRAVAGRGLAGNVDQGGRRQVTILERRAWRAAAAASGRSDLDPSTRRANLMVSGIELADSAGRVLAVGEVRIQVRGATHGCGRMDAAQPGLRAAIGVAWRGGVYGEVLADGEISVGDPVRWLPDEPTG